MVDNAASRDSLAAAAGGCRRRPARRTTPCSHGGGGSQAEEMQWSGGPRLITRGEAEPVGCDGEGWVVADGGGDRRTELVVATVKSSLISSHVQPEELQVGCKDRAGGGVHRSVTG